MNPLRSSIKLGLSASVGNFGTGGDGNLGDRSPRPHPQGFGEGEGARRMVKSESEDSGVELTSCDTVCPSPGSSERSFSLDSPASRHKLESALRRTLSWQPPGTEAEAEAETETRGSAETEPERIPKFRSGDAEKGKEAEGEAEEGDEEVDWLRLRRCWTADSTRACSQERRRKDSRRDTGQGLGYLRQVCRLLEMIGQLQENNLLLRRQKEEAEEQLRQNQDLLLTISCCGQFPPTLTQARHPVISSQPPSHHPVRLSPRQFRRQRSSSVPNILLEVSGSRPEEPRENGDGELLPSEQIDGSPADEEMDCPPDETDRPAPSSRSPKSAKATRPDWGRVKELVNRLKPRQGRARSLVARLRGNSQHNNS
ncbi:uncharacterized protein LOC121851053 [Callorhinchus milii]|uniref:uncharacterized protein LOC121851053 n=1 Tax=Callorhinchus milii TaxID=7868 RepID=UPI001C3F97D5|nr:uncharacterized protein LOC121851053 [Callorhinchus milii]